MELAPGTTLAGYRIEGIAGRGGMGVVYRATQLALDRPVAVKVIAPELARDPDFRHRFERESRLAASVDHPNVVPVHEAGEADGLLYITMRLVEGEDLGRVIARHGALDPRRAARMAGQLGGALDAAHTRGLVHRDVKPGNVLIAGQDEREIVYLTDFGLTKDLASESGGLTQSGHWVGTLDYVAPEQIEGRSIDARADVYALGCLLFHALAGEVPFVRDSQVAKIYAHLNDPPPALSSRRSGLPAPLDAVLDRAMEKRPEDRHPSAGDLARALRAAAEGAPFPTGERSVAAGAAAPEPATSAGTLAPAGAGGQSATAPLAAAPPTGATAPLAGASGPGGPAATEPGGATPGWGATAASPGVSDSRPRSRLPVLVAAGAAALVALIVLVILLRPLLGGKRSALEATSLEIASVDVPGEPTGVAVGEGGVWVTANESGTLLRVDPDSGEPDGEPIRVGGDPTSVAVGEGRVWVVSSTDGTLARVDPESREVVGQPVEIGAGIGEVAVGEGAVWVVNSVEDTVVKVDPETNRIDGQPIAVPGGARGDIAVGEGGVWVTNSDSDSITRIDPDSSEVDGAPIPAGDQFSGDLAVGEGGVWVEDPDDEALVRVDPGSRETDSIPLEGQGDVAVGAGAVWVAGESDDELVRIDPKTRRVKGRPARVSASSDSEMAIGEDAAWITEPSGNTLTRVGF